MADPGIWLGGQSSSKFATDDVYSGTIDVNPCLCLLKTLRRGKLGAGVQKIQALTDYWVRYTQLKRLFRFERVKMQLARDRKSPEDIM